MTNDSLSRPAGGEADAALSRLDGHIERAAADRLEGWCWDAARPGVRLTAEILLDERPVAVVPAALFRRDLAQKGIGDGRHAFVFHVLERPEPGKGTQLDRAHVDRSRLDAAGMIELREQSSGRIIGRLRQHAAGHTEAEDAHLARLHRLLVPLAQVAERDLPAAPASRLRAAFGALSDRLEAQADGWPRSGAADGEAMEAFDPIACAAHRLLRSHAPVRLPIVAAPAVTLVLRAATASQHRQALAALAPDLADLSAEILLIDDDADPMTALLPLLVANLAVARTMPGRAAPAAFTGGHAPLVAWLDAEAAMPHRHALNAMLAAAAGGVVVGARVAAAAAELGLLDLLAPRWLAGDDAPACMMLATERSLLEVVGGADPALGGSQELALLDMALKLRMLGRRIQAVPITDDLTAGPNMPAAHAVHEAGETARAAMRQRWCGRAA